MHSTQTDTLSLAALHAMEKRFSFVSYRLPNQTETTTLLQWKSKPSTYPHIAQIKDASGFVFAPFEISRQFPVYLIRPDAIIKGQASDLPDLNLIPSRETPPMNAPVQTAVSRYEYIRQVKSLQQVFRQSYLDKVVLSRISREPAPEGFAPTRFFEALHKAYPHAFVYILFIPEAGLWFGASPEPLLNISGGKACTVSLAGTRPLTGSDLPWGEKEIQEQQIVTSYIEKVLQKNHITGFEMQGPVTHPAGNVEHLLTRFHLHKVPKGEQLWKFLEELHPTPSVCGLPKKEALEIIHHTEKHHREYYTGFLGPVNMDEDLHLYVNLRCMKVTPSGFQYYLGAGITQGSDPQQEWEETLNKKNTLQHILASIEKY